MKKTKNPFIIVLLILFSIFVLPLSVSAATPVVTINSPLNGSTLNNDIVTISGTASADSSIKVLVDNVQRAFVMSDGSGSWTAQLTGLTAGDHTITAKVITNNSIGVFTTVDLGTGNAQLNTIDQSTNTLNGRAGWPVSLGASTALVANTIPGTNTAYVLSGSVIPGGNYVAKINTATPGPPQVVPSYPAASSPALATFNLPGTKAIILNGDGTISFVDVDSNSVTSTISPGLGAFNFAVTLANGLVYATITDTSTVVIIDPATESILSSYAACNGVSNSLATIAKDPSNSNQYYEYCIQPTASVIVRSIVDESELRTFPVAHAGLGFSVAPDGVTIATPRQGAAIVDIYSTNDGALIQSVPTTAPGYIITYSPDGQKIYLATPGAFDTNNIDIITVSDWSIVSIATPGLAFVLTGHLQPTDSTSSASILLTLAAPASATPGSLASTGDGISYYAAAILMTDLGLAILYFLNTRKIVRKH